MPTVLFMGGIFNIVDPFFGLTIYMWSWIFFIIISLITWAIMYFLKWKPLSPLHGLYYALKNGSAVAFIFDRFLNGELLSERDAKCIFNYGDDDYDIEIPDSKLLTIPLLGRLVIWWHTWSFYYPTRYLKNIDAIHALVYRIAHVNKDVEIAAMLEGQATLERSATVVCAGAPLDMVLDMDSWTVKTSPQHKAIVRSARQWNELNPTDQIHSYGKYQRYINERKITSVPKELTMKTEIPWQEIDAAFPLDLDPNEWAGKKRQMAADFEAEDTLLMTKFQMWLLIGGLGFAFFIIIIRFLMKFVH